jgi:WD40 repeat protein
MELKLAKLDFIRKSRPIGAEKYQENKRFVKVTTKQCHRGWVTKIKYYSDMQRILSCSLDGCIHFHFMDGLTYNEGKTFNLHQKGINSFVYSQKWKIIASCGEERFICAWCPITLSCLAYLRGHTTSVQDVAMNEDRNHLISLGSDKTVKIWDV